MGLDPAAIGRFTVLGTLGQGAMGTVYLGEDPALHRGVALKVVHGGKGQGQGQDREQALRRFRREAEISARLNHPNVITVFDVGEDPEVGPFLAMEFVEGDSLEALLRSGPLPPARALEVLVQAAAALEAAHAAGIVHRDIKPANLMVARDGRVKLMDFGIALEEERGATTAALLCTPGYAAPELLEGAPAGPATDRWAFAVTAYECLRARAPFAGDSISVILYQVAHGAPDLAPDLDPALAAVFRRALAKAPADRFPTLAALLEALVRALPLEEALRRRHLDRLPAAPAPVAAPRPRNLRALGLGLGALLLAALAGLGWWQGLLLPRHLRVESEPSGAWISADGERVGRTPAQDLTVPARTRVLQLDLEDHFPYPYTLAPGDGALRLRLTPARLRLDFDTRPSGARVHVDGRLVGTTPLRGVRVPHTPHGSSLLVTAPGFRSYGATLDPARLPSGVLELEPEEP